MSNNVEMTDLANRITRSTILRLEMLKIKLNFSSATVAVIDTVAARGGFKGEELATIGQLRDQCIALIQIVEDAQAQAVE